MAKYIDADKIINYANEEVTGVFCYPQGQRKLDEDAHRDRWAFVREVMIVAPAVDVAPRWIPVTESLPEEHEEVLTYDSVFGITFDSIRNGKWRKQPVAWMPLPTPYKGGEEE